MVAINTKKQKISYFLLLIIPFIFFNFKNNKVEDKMDTHTIVCSSVHLREYPNSNSKSLGTAAFGEKVACIKQSKFKEKIKIDSGEPIENWFFCRINSKQGWIYGGCLKPIPHNDYKVNIDENLYLSNRVMRFYEISDEFEYENADIKKCYFSGAGDCDGGELYFVDDSTVIYSFFCCCSTSTYRKGKYRKIGNEIICNFGTEKYVAEYQHNSENYKVNVEISEPFSQALSVNYCKSGELYLYEKKPTEKVSIYAVYSSLTVNKMINLMKKEKVWELLNKKH